MGIISYAQNFEDVLLNRVFGGVDYGFYVDIGASHPSVDSVTKTFYDRGWSGINVEPGDIFAELAAARPRDVNLRMAVYDHAGDLDFAQQPEGYAGLSRVQEAGAGGISAPSGVPEVQMRRVACDTLGSILQTHAQRRPISFLKIDAEGSELTIIRSTDWRAIRPTVLVIEATKPLSNELDNAEWEPILLEQGYVPAYFDGINCFYVPEERSDLLRHFALPVNVLDGFVRPEPAAAAACREELQGAHERIAALAAELAAAQGEHTRVIEQNRVLAGQNELYVGLMQAHAQTVDELRRQYDARVAASSEDRDRLAAEATETAASLKKRHQEHVDNIVAEFHRTETALRRQHEDQMAGLAGRLGEAARSNAMLAEDAFRLHHLVHDLRWPGGPGAIRAVLPLARLLRRLRGTRAAAEPPRGAAPPPAPAAPVMRRSLARRLALLAYRPVRPLVRPIAWRCRTFLTGEILGELARQNYALQSMLAQSGSVSASAIQGMLPPFHAASGPPTDTSALQAEIRQFGAMLETTLLTLALEREPMPSTGFTVLGRPPTSDTMHETSDVAGN
jgi:FkbM family methyltransferase